MYWFSLFLMAQLSSTKLLPMTFNCISPSGSALDFVLAPPSVFCHRSITNCNVFYKVDFVWYICNNPLFILCISSIHNMLQDTAAPAAASFAGHCDVLMTSFFLPAQPVIKNSGITKLPSCSRSDATDGQVTQRWEAGYSQTMTGGGTMSPLPLPLSPIQTTSTASTLQLHGTTEM